MTKFAARFVLCIYYFVLGCSLFGCGSSDVDQNLQSVKGTIKLDGAPITSEGTITFVSEDGQAVYSGVIDPEGKYTVNASQSATGAVPGNYQVAIQSWETSPGMEEDGTPIEGKSAIGLKYHDPKTSELTATVTDGDNVIDFDLTKE